MNNQLMEILLSANRVSDTIAKTVTQFVNKWNCSVYEALLETSIFTQAEIADIIARECKLDRIYNVAVLCIDEDLLNLIPFTLALEVYAIPLRYIGDGKVSLEILITDPTRLEVIEKLKNITKCELTLVIGEKDDIINTIKAKYSVDKQVPMILAKQ